VSAPRVLIIDGNVASMRARQIAALGYDAGGGYARVLRAIDPTLQIDIVLPADAEPAFPPGVGLEHYDGVAITGSALNIYHGGPAVTRQIDLVQAVFAAGIPLFGSCWGLQLAVTAAGGTVRANPLGREFGFARRVAQSEAGRAHPLYAGKPAVFEAPTIHRDEISALPTGAQVLASNDYGVQAAVFDHAQGSFWGVQYHPEYDYLDLAAAAERYGETLERERIFTDESARAAFVADLRTLQLNPADAPLLWRYGLGPAMSDLELRRLELRNWLQFQLRPFVQRRR
jgi:GMP synthase (glutamine-hydrolysing)